MIDQHSIEIYAPEIARQPLGAGGHFIATRLEDFSEKSVAATALYSRKDFYKISLITGHTSYYVQDRAYHFKAGEWSLVFANRDYPYRWEVHEGTCNGYSCMFTEDFLPLHTYIRPSDWPVFNGQVQAVLQLKSQDSIFFKTLFQKMLQEQASAYTQKYDLLFLYVMECIHGAMKLEPEPELHSPTAAVRLADAFKTLLAGQFPLVYPHHKVTLRNPQEYADRLSVHPNYLNRVLKEITGRTTTQLIHERLMQEARALLLHSNCTISQISSSLGFEEATHFSRAFRGYTGQTPSSLRASV